MGRQSEPLIPLRWIQGKKLLSQHLATTQSLFMGALGIAKFTLGTDVRMHKTGLEVLIELKRGDRI